MSFNHLSYDTCYYARHLRENVSILDYTLSPYRYEHANKCRHELGLVGGSAVSHINGNMVDLESDLRGQTRYISWCTESYSKPLENSAPILTHKTAPIDTTLKHLPACQMIGYRSVPLPPFVETTQCRH